MDKAIVATRLDPQTYKALLEIARQQDRKPAYLLRKAVEQYVVQQQKKARQAA